MIEQPLLNTVLLAEGMILSSVWKPLLILPPIVAWAWVVSKVYDKHANLFALPRRAWNLGHMGAGLLGLLLCLFLPPLVGANQFAFFAGWIAMIIVLVVDLVVYPMKANKDDRVTAKHRITLNYILKSEQATKKDKGKQDKNLAKVLLTLRAADEKGKFTIDIPAPQAETPEYEVRAAAEQMYIAAINNRAAQVDIQPATKDTYSVTYLVDGVAQKAGEPLPLANAVKIMDFWRGAAKLDINDRRRKQQNAMQIEGPGGRHTARLTSAGVQGGMRVTMLFDPETAVNRKLENLGMLPMQTEELKKIVAEAKGVVLLAARPDQGRTTTLYAVTRLHDAYTQNVQTVEMEPQGSIEGVRANRFDPNADASTVNAAGPAGAVSGGEYSTLVRSILRRDPTVVSVAELPDAATAKEITKSDHERTRIYVSIPAGDALTAIQGWAKMVGEPRAAGACLHGVVGQRLVRKLCGNCRVAYPPTPDMLKKLGLPEGKIQQLFKKGGQVLIKNKPEVCPICKGSGYMGQEGIFEVYSLDKEERELISTGNLQGLRATFKKRQLPSLQQVAIRKAVDGVTSVEEVLRVTTDPTPGSTPQQPAAPAPAKA